MFNVYTPLAVTWLDNQNTFSGYVSMLQNVKYLFFNVQKSKIRSKTVTVIHVLLNVKQNVNSVWKLTQTLVRRLLRVPDMIFLHNKSNP